MLDGTALGADGEWFRCENDSNLRRAMAVIGSLFLCDNRHTVERVSPVCCLGGLVDGDEHRRNGATAGFGATLLLDEVEASLNPPDGLLKSASLDVHGGDACDLLRGHVQTGANG